MHGSEYPSGNQDNDSDQKHDDRNLVDTVHHLEVEIIGFMTPKEVTPHFPQCKVVFEGVLLSWRRLFGRYLRFFFHNW